MIVGLGKSGLSCARYLHDKRASLRVIDTRQQPPGLQTLQQEMPDVSVHTGDFDSDWFAQADELVVSPGVAISQPAISDAMTHGTPVLGDIELFAHAANAPVVAITGTNGKSTVTMLLAEMAAKAQRHYKVGGNLGTPALDLLGDDSTDIYILELSSFQLETTQSLNAVAAVVLNVAPDHMDRYDDMQDYANTKQRIYAGNGVMVINKDDAYASAMHDASRTSIYFTLSSPNESEYGLHNDNGVQWFAKGNDRLFSENDIKLRGRHNYANILAALALAEAAGLPQQAAIQACREFAGLAHRCQWLTQLHGVNFYNDSKATNVAATVATLRGLNTKSVLIAGGQSKESDYAPLVDAVRDCCEAVVLIGRDAKLIAAALANTVPVHFADDMHNAVNEAYTIASDNAADVVLAPACASFDMFENFEHRGDVFSEAVRGLQP